MRVCSAAGREALPSHELEHTLARSRDDEFPEAARAAFDRAGQLGLSIELVALEPGEEPDWDGAERFIEAIVLEEIEDDLLEQCGVDPDQRSQGDVARDREAPAALRPRAIPADVEGDGDQIEQWSFRDGRIFASIGSPDDESDPLSGHGWMCRLVDAGVLGAAGFERVRKTELEPV